MFRQEVIEGFQHENPDYWLNFGNPWEIERPNIAYPIKFYGNVEILEVEGRQAYIWNSGEEVTAIAYDTPIPGWNTPNTINLRLWSAKPSREFDLESFNTGDYVQAILAKQRAEPISPVLYPDDRTYQPYENHSPKILKTEKPICFFKQSCSQTFRNLPPVRGKLLRQGWHVVGRYLSSTCQNLRPEVFTLRSQGKN